MTAASRAFMHLGEIACAVDPDDTSTIHALTPDGLYAGWPDGLFHAPCGATVRVQVGRNDDDQLRTFLWPPRVRTIAPIRRCLACHQATGTRRPAW